MPLLRTKLHKPRIVRGHLHRQHLLDRLDRSLKQPLMLVSAPAGYGKSTLLAYWLETSDIPGAWVSLDKNDNDLHLFLAYFLDAVQTLFPGAVDETKVLLNAPNLPPLKVLAHSLINELHQIDHSFILVLDDYHAISDKTVHSLMAELLQHPPAPLHLVLSSRLDPPLPLARFRARSQMGEIRVGELRFSKEETGALLKSLIGESADGKTTAILGERTEGWIAGLRLAALSLQHRPDLNHVVAGLPVGSRYITDYLFAEVLSKQPGEIKDYLLATAILDRFCAPLCDAVCVPGSRSLECKMGGEQFVEWLEKSDLFVISLDEQGWWFRYHHLFQKLLLNHLKDQVNRDDFSGLYMRASRWFAENNLIDEAFQYALSAGNASAAAQLVEQNRHTLLNEDKWYVLEKWLGLLPDGIVQQRPELLLAKAWVFRFQFSLWAIPPLLKTIETLLSEEAKERLCDEIDHLKGFCLFWQGQGKHSLELFGGALERISAANIGVRNDAEMYFALSSQITGQGKSAVYALRKKFYNEKSEGTRKLRLLGTLLFIYMLSGDLILADEAARQVKNLVIRLNNRFIQAWVSYIEGIIHYQWNKLETASHHFSQAVKKRYYLGAYTDIDSYAGLSLSYQAMQQPGKANEIMSRLTEYAQESGNPDYLPHARCVQARLCLLQGDLESAGHWLETEDISFDTGTMLFWSEVPRITQCRVLVAQGTTAALCKAKEKLRKHLAFSQATHNTPQMIEILLLQAMAWQKQDQTKEALAALERAVILSRPGGYIRPFVSLGKKMADLLRRLSQHGNTADHIGRILTAFGAYKTIGGQVDSSHRPEQLPWGRNQALNNPLTGRELEVLSLMGHGLRNKDIADRLYDERIPILSVENLDERDRKSP